MNPRFRAAVEFVLAVGALVGAAASWLHTRSTVVVAPVIDGQPNTWSTVYHPGPLMLTLFLATVAGILTVLGLARLRRPSGRLLDQGQYQLTAPHDGIGQVAQGLVDRTGEGEHRIV